MTVSAVLLFSGFTFEQPVKKEDAGAPAAIAAKVAFEAIFINSRLFQVFFILAKLNF
jgi:hypothetical protein